MGLGDDMMWLGEAAEVHDKNPAAVITDGREVSIMWKHHDWVVAPDYQGSRKLMHVPRKPGGNRWYIDGWHSGRIIYKNYQPKPCPYIVSEDEHDQALQILDEYGLTGKSFVVVNPDTKNTTLSTNKDWGLKRWQQLTDLLSKKIDVVRIKPKSSVQDVSGHVEYKQKMLDNATNIVEDSVRVSFAIMSLSKAIITSEGGVHHFAAAINKPAFVIYGGVIHPDQTGYRDREQTYYFVGDEPCGSQYPCTHCKDSMAAIKPYMIYDDVLEEINGI
jgi:ADP-heptose:LPS heptosyltransferase